MRKRNINIFIRLNESENQALLFCIKKTGLTKGSYIRSLICGERPREQPSEEFFEVIAQLRAIGNNLNQIAMIVNHSGYIDVTSYQQEVMKLRKEILEIRKIDTFIPSSLTSK